jgi:hypothetical protein
MKNLLDPILRGFASVLRIFGIRKDKGLSEDDPIRMVICTPRSQHEKSKTGRYF